MKGSRGTKEKRVCVSQRAQTTGDQFTDRNLLWISLEIPIIWTGLLVLWDRGCFIVVGYREWLHCQDWTRFLSILEKCFSRLTGRIEKSPCSSSDPYHGKLGGHWKGRSEDWRSLKWLNLLKNLFFMSWVFFFFLLCFAMRVFISFRGFHLPQLKNKNFK